MHIPALNCREDVPAEMQQLPSRMPANGRGHALSRKRQQVEQQQTWLMPGVCVQIEEAKAHLDQRKGDMQSLEAEVQRANERAKELEEEARKAR